MQIRLDGFIQGLDHQVPALHPGELHLFIIEQFAWLKRLSETVCQQQRLLFIDEFLSEQTELAEQLSCETRSDYAHWSRRKYYSAKGITRMLNSVGRSYDVLILRFDSQLNSPIYNFVFKQGGLLHIRRWARQHHKLVLVMFSADRISKEAQELIRHHNFHCHSVNTIYPSEQFWRWDVLHWFADGQVLQPRFKLEQTHSGDYRILREQQAEFAKFQLKGDQAPVYYVNNALDGNEVAPREWQMLNQVEDWYNGSHMDTDDALILSYYRGQSLHSLLRDIYDIRRQHGPYVRIYVRERDQAIRHQDERLLLQAGATLILPVGLRFSQVVSLVENSSGWRFVRELPGQFEEFEKRLVPQNLEGYLTLPVFAEKAHELAQLAVSQGVDFSFITAKPSTGLSCLDVLKSFNHRREGDIASSDGRYVYLFLYACPETDVDRALLFLFGGPAQTLLAEDKRIHSIYNLETALDKINRMTSAPDLTDALFEIKQNTAPDDRFERYFPKPKAAQKIKLG